MLGWAEAQRARGYGVAFEGPTFEGAQAAGSQALIALKLEPETLILSQPLNKVRAKAVALPPNIREGHPRAA